jgi:hypothetical protein
VRVGCGGAIQPMSGALRWSTMIGAASARGHAATRRLAAEPTMRAGGPLVAARTASRIGAIRGGTTVRPPAPNTCR